MTRDPYDVAVAFDDIYGDGAVESPAHTDVDALAHVSKKIMHHAHRRRLAPPPMIILGAGYDPTYQTFEMANVTYRVIGAEYEPRYQKFEMADVMYQIIGAADADATPIYDDLKQRFTAAQPTPKLVRVDTVATYADFRSARRQPYLAFLEARLEALENAFASHLVDDEDLERRFEQHISDGHGGSLDDHGDQVVHGIAQYVVGGVRVPLPLPPEVQNKIECWQDGNEVLCTARVLGCDGKPRLLTTGVPLEQHIHEVIGCAEVMGADFDDVVKVTPVLAPVLAGTSLLPQLCRAAPDLVARPETLYGAFVGSMTSACDPSLAAAMALLQRCQRDDAAACREANTLASDDDGRQLLTEARKRLLQGQYEKSRRLAS